MDMDRLMLWSQCQCQFPVGVSVQKETPLNQWTSSPLSAILRLYEASVLITQPEPTGIIEGGLDSERT